MFQGPYYQQIDTTIEFLLLESIHQFTYAHVCNIVAVCSGDLIKLDDEVVIGGVFV